MNVSLSLPTGMMVAEFLRWAEEQSRGRFELLDGEVVAMAPEQVGDARRKLAVCDRLRAAISEAGLPCETFIDSIGVATDEKSVLIPDVLVQCGEPLEEEQLLAPSPVIIVEVLSPSTRAIDLTYKLERYFRLTSLQHYLVARTNTSAILHYRRSAEGISMQIVSGSLRLDPLGIEINLS
jgi:Uma2 family endonuclease